MLELYFGHLGIEHITVISRQQLQIGSLEDKIIQGNPARAILPILMLTEPQKKETHKSLDNLSKIFSISA